MSGRTEFLCYTDGSCKAGDGAPGGWGYCVDPPNGPRQEGYGTATHTLAKCMEYRAVAEALAILPEAAAAVVFSDSQALIENLDKRLNGWRIHAFANVDPLIVDSVQRIAAAIHDKHLRVRWQWVRGHNGNAGNERADFLAAKGAREAKRNLPPKSGR